MKIKIKDLHKAHAAVLGARLMAKVYPEHETMSPACEIVNEQFPELTAEQVMCLWLGVNAEAQKDALEE
ncbi:hypothetical protein ACOCGI_000343 [Vibrio cholerae]